MLYPPLPSIAVPDNREHGKKPPDFNKNISFFLVCAHAVLR
jgi:hypothetical protein